MSSQDSTKFRAAVARLNCLSIDRADIQYSTQEAARRMSRPCNGDWALVKNIARYVIGKPRVHHLFAWQELPDRMRIFVDSNWAGCPKRRKSTTGAAIMHGEHLVRSYSKTQSLIALSSAEAELYAMVHATSEGLGSKAMAADFGGRMEVDVYVGASAAIGVLQRKGLGKLRHLDTQALWI